MSLNNVKIGFIGAGNMAQAIGFQFIKSGVISPESILVSAPSKRFENIWKEKGVNFTNNNNAVIRNSSVVFIAVKPHLFDSVVETLETGSLDNKIFVSIMVGITLKTLKQKMPSRPIDIIRTIPNTPCMVGAGYTAMCTLNQIPNDADNLVLRLMRLTGSCDIVDEKLVDPLSALGGSSPAYMYMVIEALSDGAVKLGVPRAMAMQVAAQMMRGASEMVLKTGKHPGELKDEVCSPGGTTICGVHELEKAGIRAAFMNALQAAVSRTQELAKNA